MEYQVKFSRPWPVSPRGAPEMTFGPGVLSVPEDISHDLASRALRAGRAQLHKTELPPAPETAVVPPRGKRKLKAIAQAADNKAILHSPDNK